MNLETNNLRNKNNLKIKSHVLPIEVLFQQHSLPDDYEQFINISAEIHSYWISM